MGAETTWNVRVLMAGEGIMEISAVTGDEAMKKAEREPNVIRALSAEHAYSALNVQEGEGK